MKVLNKILPLTMTLLIASGLVLTACSVETSADFTDELTTSSTTDTAIEQSTEESSPFFEEDVDEEDVTSSTENLEGANRMASSGVLSDAVIEHLVFMREEEKLAHDVYLSLFERWGLVIFKNIAASEQTHMDAVKNLLEKYDIPDPADTSPAGVFANPDLQQLYDDLIQRGESSLGEALKVGAAIEEIDILDLQEALDDTQTADIRRVFENLLKGSENHLRAFTSTLLRQTGETYAPQYLTQEAFDAIMSETAKRGPADNGRGGGRRP